MSKSFSASVATLIAISLLLPATLLMVPQRVSAQGATQCQGGLIGAGIGAIFSLFSSVPTGDAGTQTASGYSAGAGISTCVYETIIKPLIRWTIHLALQMMTMSVINWINGANGSGQPSFVVNLGLHLQAVGDAVALPFINQVQMLSNPAFASSIASSLLFNYARQTSVGGFFAGANQNALSRASPNPTAFAAGDWSQGGTSAWLALATDNQSNPYTYYYAAQDQLASNVAQAQTNRRQDLNNGNGFLSFCGPQGGGGGGPINPGASCINSNGTPGSISTPGSVIKDYTQQALGADVAQFINPADIDQSFAAIAATLLTQGVNRVFGPQGLFGTSHPTSIRPTAITSQLQTSASGNLNSIGSANTAAQSKITQVTNYTTAWNTIATAAQSASGALTSLKNSCSAKSAAAQAALDSEVTPVITQAQAALNSVAGVQAFARQVQQEAASNAPTLNADLQTLATMPPTTSAVAAAQANAATTGGATASSANTLVVTGGTTVDQMNLISQGAQTLSAACQL